MEIFKRYDVRGVYPEEINENIAEKLGKALGKYLENEGKIVVGQDSRTSSNVLYKAFIEGAVCSGINVIEIGLTPTPLIAFATKFFNADAGVQVTASHLTKEHNGFKFTRNDTTGFNNEQLDLLKKCFYASDKKCRRGTIEWLREEAYDAYVESSLKSLTKRFKPRAFSDISLIIDSGHGAGILTTKRMMECLGVRNVQKINYSLDGSFPGRQSNPTKYNLAKLSREVEYGNYDFGIAYDCDADRLSVIDENGNFVNGNRLFCLFAKEYLKNSPKIVASIDTSNALYDFVKGKADLIYSKVGDIFVEEAIKKHNAEFGGEPNGHWIDAEHVIYPDASFYACFLTSIVEKYNMSVSSLVSEIPKYYSFSKTITSWNKDEVMEKVKGILEKDNKIDSTDGLRIADDEHVFLLRKSGTEDILRLFIESKSKEKTFKICNQYLNLIKRFNK
ncbi:MAG: hypothetical protein PHW96_00565 [Candidatus Nanoarchaeia archaeon]|nr:hypothetical protein [Candidatus Nanoarchaeia archaeon]